MAQKTLFLFIFILIYSPGFAQDGRISTHNTIGWFAYTGAFKIKPKLTIHTEYQWRRADVVKNWQQGLFRTGLNYGVTKDVSLNLGYAFAQTFPYGDYPAAFAFPEHRIFEQVVIKNPVGVADLSHRFTLEQRFVGSVTNTNGIKNTKYNYLNRIRYRLRGEIPLHKKSAAKKNWSIAIQDEIFIGWGKNIGINIFDQNRIGVLLGYKLNKQVKIEAGYLNQTLQQGRQVNNKAVFQYNHGFLLAANFNIDLTKK